MAGPGTGFQAMALPFSQGVYYRLFEIYNMDIWPLQLIALALGLVIAVLLLRRSASAFQGRMISGILAAGWLWVAWDYHLQRLADIYWAATLFAGVFAFQAALILWTGSLRGRLACKAVSSGRHRAGLMIYLYALLGYPLAGLLPGYKWTQAQIAGLAPDPTAIAAMGLFLLARDGPPWRLLPVPLAWCVLNGATLWMMGSPAAVSPLLAALVVVFLAARHS